MGSRRRYGMGAVLLAVTLLLGGSAAVGSAERSVPEVTDHVIAANLAAGGTTDLFVKMRAEADLAVTSAISDHGARVQHVRDVLVRSAADSQRSIVRFLDARGLEHQTFWINNSLFVRGADAQTVAELAARPDVAYVRGNHQVKLHTPVSVSEVSAAPQATEWGVDMVNAPDVWLAGNTGGGVVVANIDTGVRWTHDALVGQYRGGPGAHDYNWWDPRVGLPGSQTGSPNDGNGHGSHTMGTMIGDDGGGNQIGVAPGAEWIAAKGCATSFCSDFDLISSAQWVACPTDLSGANPDCSKAPHVVNNSWGGSGGDPWYRSYVKAWLQSGIVPVFSAGNSGPQCSTTGSPGDYPPVIGVGAVDINKVLASFSSKGPGAFRRLKPDVVAPGDGVRSSIHTGDSAYAVASGTSMAAPHAAGVIALLVADTPTASIGQVRNALYGTTEQNLPNPPNPDTCGRPYTVYPNAIYGRGLIDALAATNALP